MTERGTRDGRSWAAALLACGVAACGHQTQAPEPYCSSAALPAQTVSAGGVSFTSRSATVLRASGLCACEYLVVLVSGSMDACSEYRDRMLDNAPAHVWLQLQLASPPATGSYVVGRAVDQPFGAFVAMEQFANGKTTDVADGVSGTVDISALTSTEVAGDYDITFATGEHASNTFSAPFCAPCP